jgi:hypothetical protein
MSGRSSLASVVTGHLLHRIAASLVLPLVVSGLVESGREIGHGNSDANDGFPGENAKFGLSGETEKFLALARPSVTHSTGVSHLLLLVTS